MKKALISGKFNVLHAGHLRLFRFAKEHADFLTVAVLPDAKCIGECVPENLRLDGLKNNILVDDCFILKSEIGNYISKNKPDFVIKGIEYENLFNEEKYYLDLYGGILLFCSSELIYSSSSQHYTYHTEYKITAPPDDFLDRHNISLDSLLKIITSFKKLNVLVVGDVIVDEYIFCKPMGMSREDSSIVSIPIESKKFLGGAGIVASHASSLGASCTFLTVCGNDNNKLFVENQLEKFGVQHHCLIDESRPTTHKIRYKDRDKTLFRLSHFHESKINSNISQSLINFLKKEDVNYDLIILSDFNYGVITNIIREEITSYANSNNIFISADSQSSSQFGDISSYQNCDLIFATEYEARLSLFDKESGLVSLINKLQKKTNANNLILKLGSEGILIRSGKIDTFDSKSSLHVFDDQLMAMNLYPTDTSGAGDSMLITTSMAMAVDGNLWSASLLGSIAAAIQISRVGNTPLVIEDFFMHIKK